jgi:polyprenyl-phospho-N-acetylgalactosaminyl synthase
MNVTPVEPEYNGPSFAGNFSAAHDDANQPQMVGGSRFLKPSIFVVIPAYNEGPIIRDILLQVITNKEVQELGCQVVVIDDGSTDDTWVNVTMLIPANDSVHFASQPEITPLIHLLRHVVNLGQGAALATGIQYALEEGAQIIVTFDADGQHLVEDIPHLVAPIASGLADVALGSRFIPKKASGVEDSDRKHHEETQNTFIIPWPRRVLLKIAIVFTAMTEKIWLSDVHNGLRAFSANAARQIKITQNRMAHASEIIHEIARLKLRYVEVPVHVRYTEYSRRKGQRAFDALNVIIEILEVLFTGEEQKP